MTIPPPHQGNQGENAYDVFALPDSISSSSLSCGCLRDLETGKPIGRFRFRAAQRTHASSLNFTWFLAHNCSGWSDDEGDDDFRCLLCIRKTRNLRSKLSAPESSLTTTMSSLTLSSLSSSSLTPLSLSLLSVSMVWASQRFTEDSVFDWCRYDPDSKMGSSSDLFFSNRRSTWSSRLEARLEALWRIDMNRAFTRRRPIGDAFLPSEVGCAFGFVWNVLQTEWMSPHIHSWTQCSLSCGTIEEKDGTSTIEEKARAHLLSTSSLPILSAMVASALVGRWELGVGREKHHNPRHHYYYCNSYWYTDFNSPQASDLYIIVS